MLPPHPPCGHTQGPFLRYEQRLKEAYAKSVDGRWITSPTGAHVYIFTLSRSLALPLLMSTFSHSVDH